jgi:hypothetical protein
LLSIVTQNKARKRRYVIDWRHLTVALVGNAVAANAIVVAAAHAASIELQHSLTWTGHFAVAADALVVAAAHAARVVERHRVGHAVAAEASVDSLTNATLRNAASCHTQQTLSDDDSQLEIT